MRFAFLSHTAPDDDVIWSGTPAHIVHWLERAGHHVVRVGPLGARFPLGERLRSRLYRHLRGQHFVVNRSPAVFRRRAAKANRILERLHDLDAVLVAYPPDAAYVTSSAPIIVIHDATWHQLLDFYPEFSTEHLAAATIAGGYELERRALRNADRLLYFSRWAAASATGDFGVPPEKIDVTLPGANVRDVPPRDEVMRAVQGRRGDGPCRLLFIGKDWRRKGGDTAVAITAALLDQGVDAELDVVGCVPRIAGGIPPFVRNYGFLAKHNRTHEERLHRLMLRADFFLMPSRAECAGLVFCEAAAYGVPSVATAVGGIPELIVNDRTGLTLDPGASAEAYARWIARAYRDRARYARLALGARARFDSDLNWETFVRGLLATARTAQRSPGYCANSLNTLYAGSA